MLGSIYANFPEILVSQMTDLGFEKRLNGSLRPLVCLYLRIFGVPEIGFQIRALALKKSLSGLKPKKILDAGCGLGIQTNFLKKKFPGAEIDAFDCDKSKLQFSKQVNSRKINFFVADMNNLSLKKKYDLVICIDVLEHLSNWNRAISNLGKVLSPEGKIYLHIPLKGQRRHFRRFLIWEHDTHKSQGIEEGELRKWLKDNGYQIVLDRGDHRFWGSLAWELNMIFMDNFLLGALFYPLFFLMIYLDSFIGGKKYNCLSLIVEKRD